MVERTQSVQEHSERGCVARAVSLKSDDVAETLVLEKMEGVRVAGGIDARRENNLLLRSTCTKGLAEVLQGVGVARVSN